MPPHNDGDDNRAGSTGLIQQDSLDRLFSILANERRRRILLYLHGKDDDVATFMELIDYLMVCEAESVDDLEGDEVAMALYHAHFPKLADAGIIEYDTRSRTVRYRENLLIEKWLQIATEEVLA